ncbi:MAG: hypothetical protein H6977_20060 [Gammaproteobacteria bacterium]|nr:hypothetical protein [Gammaproteobacteria bacterium]
MGRYEHLQAEQAMPRLRHLTTLMLAAAAAEQWGMVARLRGERARLLEALPMADDAGVATAA